jgi:hypothetical protein
MRRIRRNSGRSNQPVLRRDSAIGQRIDCYVRSSRGPAAKAARRLNLAANIRVGGAAFLAVTRAVATTAHKTLEPPPPANQLR